MNITRLIVGTLGISFIAVAIAQSNSCTVEAGHDKPRGNYVYARYESRFAPIHGKGPGLFDPSQAKIDVDTTNVSVTTTSGDMLLMAKNNNVAIASHTFGFYRAGNSFYFSDPAAVEAWADNQTNADSFEADASGIQTEVTNPDADTAYLTANAVYMGVTQASSTTSWHIDHFPPVCPPPGTNCQLQGPTSE